MDMHRTADDDDSPSSPELSLEALEKRGLAVLVSFKNDDLIRRSNVSFLSLLAEHSSSSLSSLADVAMAEDHMVSHAVLGRGSKRSGHWLDDASTKFEMAFVDHMISSDEEESAPPPTQPAPPPKKRTSLRGRVVSPNAESMMMHVTKGVVPTSLYSEGDEDHINPIHNIIRRDILEVFIEQQPDSSSSNTVQSYDANGNNKATKAKHTRFAGRVGLRCRFCKHLPVGSNNANLATIYPESLEGIYRACSVRFQKRHVATCDYIPASIRTELDTLIREKSCRGSKNYWVESALRLGFRTSENNKGIIFCPDARY